MKSYEEVTAALLRRREEYEKQKKRQRLLLTRMGVMAASCALVAVLAVQPLALPESGGIPPLHYEDADDKVSNRGPNSNLPDPDDQLSNLGPGNKVPFPGDDEVVQIDPDEDFAVGDWKGKAVTGQLLEWLTDASAEDALPLIWAKPGIDMTYVYQGKTLQEYWDAAETACNLKERLLTLCKLADSLQYGDALYTTGTPTGEKWDEELYREIVTYIGQDLLDQYLADGCLAEKMEEILEEKEYDSIVAQGAWNNAVEGYRDEICSVTKGVLLAQGLEAYHPGNYVGIGNITKAQFEALDTAYFKGWTFGMKDPDAPQDMTDDDKAIAGVGTDKYTSDSSLSGLLRDNYESPVSSLQPDYGNLPISVVQRHPLYKKYPEYFDLEDMKGIEVYLWKVGDAYYCGALSGTNRNKTEAEIQALMGNGATIEEMKTILSLCQVQRDRVCVILVEHPFSGFFPGTGSHWDVEAGALFWGA